VGAVSVTIGANGLDMDSRIRIAVSRRLAIRSNNGQAKKH
jgi:hypothetical protein